MLCKPMDSASQNVSGSMSTSLKMGKDTKLSEFSKAAKENQGESLSPQIPIPEPQKQDQPPGPRSF